MPSTLMKAEKNGMEHQSFHIKYKGQQKTLTLFKFKNLNKFQNKICLINPVGANIVRPQITHQ